MANEPKLTVYTLKITPANGSIPNVNRWLFRAKIGEANEVELEDSYIFGELFRVFVASLDQPEMFKDGKSNKSITANQPDIEDENVDPNINHDSGLFILDGVIEGGPYGRRRNKTSTINKRDRSGVNEHDAITSDFYFLMYMPPASNKMILMVQSYSGDSIDCVLKSFWENFFAIPRIFYKPKIQRFVPQSIIDDFKQNSTVSELEFSTEVGGETLIDDPTIQIDRRFKVTVKISPVDGDLSIQEYEDSIVPITRTEVFNPFTRLSNFMRRRGRLRDMTTKSETSFSLDSDFEIQPVIILSKYIEVSEGTMDFDLVKSYCRRLLNEELIPQIFNPDAIQER